MTTPPRRSTRTLALERPLDLVGTLRPLYRGPRDPTMRLGPRQAVRSTSTTDGPGAVSIILDGDSVVAEAWGPGADRLLDGLPAFLGLDDDETGFEPGRHPVVARLARRRRGLRLGRTGGVFDVLVPAILEQKITGTEAFNGYRRLVVRHGTPAPGVPGLYVPPPAEVVAMLSSWTWPPLGIEPRRGGLLRRVAVSGRRVG